MSDGGYIPLADLRDAIPDPDLLRVVHVLAARLTGESQGSQYYQYVALSLYGTLTSAIIGSLFLDRPGWERECELDDAWDTAKRLREAA
jgi:hypothetical protein